MPENLEKFTSPDQSKKTGKLTPEEIKEMVKKFKFLGGAKRRPLKGKFMPSIVFGQ